MTFLKNNFKKLVFIAFVVSLVIASAASLALHKAYSPVSVVKTSELSDKIKNHLSDKPEKQIYNILLLGYGGAGHPGGGLADALVLINLDTKKKIATAIAIPRDIWIDLPIRSDLNQYHKINAAYAIGNDDQSYPLKEPVYKGKHGGGQMAKYAVNKITGLAVDYYAAIDFSRFEKAIDAIGGITVEVPVAFNDYFYPVKGLENELCGFSAEKMQEIHALYSGFELEKQFTCRYEHLSFPQGLVEMNGTTALKFIRSRHSNEHGGDFARGVRQQSVITGIKNKLLTLGAVNKIDDFYKQFSGMVSTDIQEQDIVEILAKTGDPGEYSLRSLNIDTNNYLASSTSEDGQFILIPKAGIGKWNSVHTFLNNSL